MSNQGSLDRNTKDMIRSQQEIPLSWSFSKSIESFSGSQTRFFYLKPAAKNKKNEATWKKPWSVFVNKFKLIFFSVTDEFYWFPDQSKRMLTKPVTCKTG